MAISNKELLLEFKNDFLDALKTLEHSWNKAKNKDLPQLNQLNDENADLEKKLDEFEPWEALSSRFARCTDIFLSKYLRFEILELDPGFRGEIRDYIDKSEKALIISNADRWMKIRELRNKIAHEYTKEDILKTLKDVLEHTPFVIQELQKFKK